MCLAIIIGFPAYSAAATDGKIGGTSVGSISISLRIPETRQVHLVQVKYTQPSPLVSKVNFCIGITDRSVESALRQYHLKVSNQSETQSSPVYRSNENQYHPVALRERFTIQIRNTHLQNMNTPEVCSLNSGNMLHFHGEADTSLQWLLELIPE